MSSPSETVFPSKESRKISENHAILMNLPPEIILDIFSRLPIRAIVRCKCVCRQWLELVTSAAFAELHLPRSTPGLIIQHSSDFFCKMFEFQNEVDVQNHELHHKQFMEFDHRPINTNPNARIWIGGGGSVNGLLCLIDMANYYNAFYICNPITREYIALPVLEEVFQPAVCGFGVSSPSGEYKLVRISPRRATSPGKDSWYFSDPKCLIYTLGTGSWRSISVGITFHFISFPAHVYLSGSLHWLVLDAEGYSVIACFNLETELFNSFPRIPISIPRYEGYESSYEGYGSLAILGDCLCVCDCSGYGEIAIWTMKDYGVGESWTKEYVISKAIGDLYLMVREGVRPLKFFKDGTILFVWEEQGIFYYSSNTETAADLHLFEWTGDDLVMTMLYTPSLLSLERFDKENVSSF